MRSSKGYFRKKKAISNKTCVSVHTWINDMVIMKIKIKTIPSRITTYFQREVCSRRKTNTYYYRKRKWNKKVNSNSKTGTKQTFTILTDEHVARVHSVCPGSTLHIILMVQYFAVFLIVCISRGSLGTTTSPQQQNTANLKDLCEVWNNYFVFADIFGSLLGKLHEKGLLRRIYSGAM